MKAGSKLEQLLRRGEFVVSGEIGPPKSCDANVIKKHGEHLRNAADAFNLTDNQTAIVRMSSIAAGKILVDMGIEPIIQMTCRDRNRIGLQSDALGAAALGIKNILCLSGDHQRFGNHPMAKNVWDLDSIQLLQTLDGMRKGYFQCGEQMKSEPPKFFLGCAANPFADPFEFRVTRLEKKINAGADFVQTQCILDMERFERWMELVRERGLHERAYILAGVMPIKSAKAARYMQKNVAGMMVSEEICQRLEKAEDVKEEAVNLVVEQIKYLRNMKGIAGVHIMAVAWEEIIPTIVERAGLLPRPTI
ncbi:MAG: methylenetetrahydrofolate reductase [Bacillota bacterium]|uniref:Methylenetetrahydrofolate reductase n=2 Tax=Carboxydocella TaxID=178898 RepID=A0A1T4QS60_9FIRM|nr:MULTISPECIES: methylenetetrahydrofolate reductase [Carboxydocella]AVX20832.1 5,10-methylenetetrahydrofolate reductase subunit MetF [Carboxydocella thermautotrophica]AVX31251.1 5,10-methylenetetrahydrofolate reductase subunit MetF [Carboxydocella thermautotrophica]SKA06447.1 5,10-methylenetetrahydrofolate reductase (ferredoxin) [Carboxydocella sporoproducens DSM 16521]GAW29998.1 Methylenetetrahydrofolate reductase [Carboxydocella sp. ULO1]GAW30399.1 Methylenetetrahydrofolate reductase [Carbo